MSRFSCIQQCAHFPLPSIIAPFSTRMYCMFRCKLTPKLIFLHTKSKHMSRATEMRSSLICPTKATLPWLANEAASHALTYVRRSVGHRATD
jgi:hypothetical protein